MEHRARHKHKILGTPREGPHLRVKPEQSKTNPRQSNHYKPRHLEVIHHADRHNAVVVDVNGQDQGSQTRDKVIRDQK